MSKYTSGPWKVGGWYGTTDQLEITTDNDLLKPSKRIAVVSQATENYQCEKTGMPKIRNVTNDEVLENAKLIATAPVFLEALLKIEQWNSHESGLAANLGLNGVRDFYRNIAKAAIAAYEKAKGEL